VASNEADSCRALYDDIYDDLWRYVQRRSVSEAEALDTLSDVFLVAWRRFDDIPPRGRARPVDGDAEGIPIIRHPHP